MKRRSILVGSLLLGLTTLIATAAWACTEFTSLIAPKSAAPTELVEVKGTGKVSPNDAGKLMEVRWNDVKGPVLVTANAAQISEGVQTALPATADGIYFLVAVVDGRGVARTSIEVRSPNALPSAPVDNRPQVTATEALPPASATPTSPEVIGVSLLVVGSLALLGGTLFVTTRRKVARVDSSESTESLEV